MPGISDADYAEFQKQKQQVKAGGESAPGLPASDPIDAAYAEFVGTKRGKVDRGAYETYNTRSFQRSLDADTADLAGGTAGKIRIPTRFAGIDAPEMGQGELGKAAQAELERLVKENGGTIRMGMRKKDGKGRDLGILYSGEKNLNVELVRSGHAKVYEEFLPELSRSVRRQLLDAQKEAQAAQRGIWAPDSGFEDPSAWRRRAGREGSFAGHTVTQPVDPATQTMDQAFREFKRQGSPMAAAHGEFEGGKARQHLGDAIRSSERYQKDDGFLDRVLGSLDYLGNISRSAIVGGKRGGLDEAWTYAKQAAAKDRQTSATLVRDELVGKLRFGKDDKRFQIGDLGDFAADLVVDLVTDPLTWLSGGISSIAKGGKLAKVLPAAARAAGEFKLGEATAGAARWGAAKRGVGAGIGAAYGLGASDMDAKDGIGQELLAAAGGAAAGFFAPTAIEKGGKLGREVANKISDRYATWAKGSRFADFSESRELALNAYDKMRDISEWIRQGRYQALAKLESPVDRLRAAEVMEELKTEFIHARNRIAKVQAEQDARNVANGVKTFVDPMVLSQQRDLVVTNLIENQVLPGILKRESKEVADAVVAWGKHNDDVIKKLNREAFGLADGVADGKTGKGIIGIRWHIDDVYDKQAVKEVEGMMGRGQIHRAMSGNRSSAAYDIAAADYKARNGIDPRRDPGLLNAKDPAAVADWDRTLAAARDKTYGAYAENFSKKFLSDAENKAVALMHEYRVTPAEKGSVRALEKGLKYYDKLTNFAKANMLYFSMTWLKNNYFDNLAKSYVESGLHGIVDSATMGAFRQGVTKDVRDLYANKLNRAYKAADMQDAMHRGVLDNPMFKSLDDTATRAFLYNPNQIKESLEKLPVHQRLAAMVTNNVYSRAIASIGGNMEGTARMMTYIRAKEALLASPRFKNAGPKEIALAKDIAADLVKKTFFDYGDVTHFEKAVFGRLIPFYSFYSKNLPYWVKAALDPERAGRVAGFEKIFNNIGDEPTAFDKQGMGPYIADNAPRKLGTDAKGNKHYMIRPSSSMADAIKMLDVRPEGLAKTVVDKGSPLLKAGVELATGKDLFEGGELTPSQIAKKEQKERGGELKEGKKFLFARGFKHVLIKEAIEGALGKGSFANAVKSAAGVAGVELDNNGNPYTTSDADVIIDKISSTLWPKGLVDQVVGSGGKVKVGKEKALQALMNRLLPMQEVQISPEYERMVRQRKAKAKGGE